MSNIDKQALTAESARESGNILLIVAARMARRELFTPLHYVSELPQKVVSMRVFREALESSEETLQREVCKIVDGHDRMQKKLKEAEAKLEAAERRIAELSSLQGKPIAWESTTPVYVKFITDERYQRLRPGYKKWYKPYRCSLCAAAAKGEASAVCVIDQSNLDYLKSGSDADVWPASRTEMGDVLLYRTAPPAPVSVPTFEEWCELTERKPVGWVRDAMKEAYDGCRAAMLQGADRKPELTVWYGSMPESNGKANWTAILHRKGEGRCMDGFTIDRSEYPGRVLYAADRVRYLIGEKSERPSILDYDADAHSGYVKPGNSTVIPGCSCRTCRPVTISDMRFVVCPDCGNKRCPHANDHRNACTGSNEPGQEGSAYPAAPQQEVKP